MFAASGVKSWYGIRAVEGAHQPRGYVDNHREDERLRDALYALTREVFGFSLQEWWDAGWWTEDYVCRSLMEGGRMVANASTARMTLILGGVAQSGVQVGAVATRPACRGQGLARQLMEVIVDEHGGEPMFLFANDSVIDFYQRFGFRRGPAQAMPVWQVPSGRRYNPCDLERAVPMDARVLQHVVDHGARSRRFDVETVAINMFHLIGLHAQDIYVASDDSFVAVMKQAGERLDVFGLFAKEEVEPAWMLACLCRPGVEQIRYHFEPDGLGLPCSRIPHLVENTHLFVNGCFPTIEAPWVFPTLAYT